MVSQYGSKNFRMVYATFPDYDDVGVLSIRRVNGQPIIGWEDQLVDIVNEDNNIKLLDSNDFSGYDPRVENVVKAIIENDYLEENGTHPMDIGMILERMANNNPFSVLRDLRDEMHVVSKYGTL